MSGGSAHKDLKPTATRVMTALSCAAVLLSIAASGPGQKPLPGTRTAFELLASKSERDLSKLSPLLSGVPSPLSGLAGERHPAANIQGAVASKDRNHG